MKHHAIRLYDYHVWANKLVFDHLKKLPKEAAETEVQSAFPTVKAALAHIYVVDTMWLGVMAGGTFEEARATNMRLAESTKGAKPDELEKLYAETEAGYRSFFGSLGDPDREITIYHPKTGEARTRISELVQHVVNHGTYHRGQVTAILRQLGHPGVPTDYAFFAFQD